MADTRLLKSRTPKADGFFFPGEWHPHEYTIMQFVPCQNWAGYGLSDARRDWATVANTISEFEPVLMLVDLGDRQIARKLLNSAIELDVPMAVIQDTFPKRQVVGVSGKILARGGGGVHCITQQVPSISK